MNLFEIDLENILFTIYEIRVKIPQPPLPQLQGCTYNYIWESERR